MHFFFGISCLHLKSKTISNDQELIQSDPTSYPQKYRLGTVSIKTLGGGGLKPVLRDPNLALSFCHGSKHIVVRSAWRFSNSSMDHHGKTNNKYYDQTKMRTRQKQRVATDTLRSLGCRTTPLEHWSKRKPTVEPRWAKQQKGKLRSQPTKINSFMSGPSLSQTPDPPACN